MITTLLIFFLSLFQAYKVYSLERRNAQMKEDVKWLVFLCEYEADFSNGVNYNGFDEGQVMAAKMLDRVKKKYGIETEVSYYPEE